MEVEDGNLTSEGANVANRGAARQDPQGTCN